MSSVARKPSTFLVKRFDAANWPVFVFDDQRVLRYLNGAGQRVLGHPEDRLLGQQAQFHVLGQLPPAIQALSDICPSADAFSGKLESRQIQLGDRQSDQPELHWSVIYSPLIDSKSPGTGAAVLVTMFPIDQASDVVPASDQDQLHSELHRWRSAFRAEFATSRLVGESTAIQRVQKQIELAAATPMPVVVHGAAGSGTEQVARSICYRSGPGDPRRVMSLQGDLMDAEIMQSSVRAFLSQLAEDADQGDEQASLILLGADRMELSAQSALLHTMQRTEAEWRIVCTARESLLALAAKGAFREDLAYRLSTLEIALPPLCDRPEDIPLIAQAVIEELNLQSRHQVRGIEPGILEQMIQMPWPGNLDELADVVRQAHARSTHAMLSGDDFALDRLPGAREEGRSQEDPAIQLDDFLLEVEQELIMRALRQTHGNKTKAAELLGISRPRLHRRLEQLRIEDPE